MGHEQRIVLDPEVLVGKPIIRGTRISVAWVLGLMAESWAAEELAAEYPNVAREDILTCLAYARVAIEGERDFPNAA